MENMFTLIFTHEMKLIKKCSIDNFKDLIHCRSTMMNRHIGKKGQTFSATELQQFQRQFSCIQLLDVQSIK